MKKQNYDGLIVSRSSQMDLSFVSMRCGTFMHVQYGEQAVEIRVDDAGKMQVCVSDNVEVKSFTEVYGK